MNKLYGKRPGLASGFTIVELLVVIIVLAVLALMAIPSVLSIVPTFQVRSATEATTSMLYMARLSAATTQRPARAVVNCLNSDDKDLSCRLSIDNAVFNAAGTLTGWTEAAGTARWLGREVRVSVTTGSKPFAPKQPANVYWAVFLPSGKVAAASHDPLDLVLRATGAASSRTVSLARTNGNVTIK